MKPLIFQFLEKSTRDNMDFSMIDYDFTLNLSVDKHSRKPVIDILSSETAAAAISDGKNKAAIEFMMGTMTRTAVVEGSDSD